eukprot:Pgem_evm11s12025
MVGQNKEVLKVQVDVDNDDAIPDSPKKKKRKRRNSPHPKMLSKKDKLLISETNKNKLAALSYADSVRGASSSSTSSSSTEPEQEGELKKKVLSLTNMDGLAYTNISQDDKKMENVHDIRFITSKKSCLVIQSKDINYKNTFLTYDGDFRPFYFSIKKVKTKNYSVEVFLRNNIQTEVHPNSYCQMYDFSDIEHYIVGGNTIEQTKMLGENYGIDQGPFFKYVYVGTRLVIFYTREVIIDYLSYLSQGKVPWSIAFGQKYVYDLTSMVYYERADISKMLNDQPYKNIQEILFYQDNTGVSKPIPSRNACNVESIQCEAYVANGLGICH